MTLDDCCREYHCLSSFNNKKHNIYPSSLDKYVSEFICTPLHETLDIICGGTCITIISCQCIFRNNYVNCSCQSFVSFFPLVGYCSNKPIEGDKYTKMFELTSNQHAWSLHPAAHFLQPYLFHESFIVQLICWQLQVVIALLW